MNCLIIAALVAGVVFIGSMYLIISRQRGWIKELREDNEQKR